MVYRINYIVNMALCCLFVAIAACLLLASAIKTSYDIIFPVLFLLVNIIFLLFGFIYNKIAKCNAAQPTVLKPVKIWGWILFPFAAIGALGMIAAAFVAIGAGLKMKGPEQGFYYLVLFLFFLSGLTTILNLISFIKTLKNNKAVVNDFINNIGASA
jgi:hypothetical protein